MMYPYALPAYRLKRKVVIHVREHWPEKEHSFQFKIAQRIIQNYSDRIIGINEASAEMIGISKKTQIIYDWIDFENRNEKIDFERIFGGDFKTLKIFLFLGGTIWIKGALEVVDVFSNQISSKQARLLVVGTDKKEIDYSGAKGEVRKMLAHLHYYRYSDKVKLLAQKDERVVFITSTYQIKSLIEQSFCLVSFFTIPHANLPIAEATWLGKPSISADTPEAREYSDDGKAALLFNLKNIEEFKERMIFALENEELVNNNAQEGSLNIRKKFDPVRNSELLNNVYKDLIKKNIEYV
jgi:glycosyltransferase involved in cell wall biosynthesis